MYSEFVDHIYLKDYDDDFEDDDGDEENEDDDNDDNKPVGHKLITLS